jgi:hypothetical protein
MKSCHNKEFPSTRLVLLAPPEAFVPRRFENVRASASRYDQLLASLQRLRGRVYLEDGAIAPSQLASGGRHLLPGDEHAWHVVALDEAGEVAGCSRYLAHPNTVPFHRLSVRHAALADSAQWGEMFRGAVAQEVELARRRGVAYVEVGGWALAPKLRRTREALRVALATFGLARALGGCIGITTATRRHCSSDILRRIGGRSLHVNQVDLPAYYDPQYGCQMEVLRFDSIQASPRFEPWVSDLCTHWLQAPVIRVEAAPQRFYFAPQPVHFAAHPFRAPAAVAARATWGFEAHRALAVQ